MDTIQLIGATMGLGFVAGIRLYATVLALGLAIRFGWLHPGAVGAPLEILAHPAVLTAAGVAYLAEFLADKIPWIDSVWDTFHTLIRPIGAAVLAATVLGDINPVVRLTLILLCGGVAFASHSSKAAIRLVVNHSPEPFTNIGLSLAGDVLAPFGVWLSLSHPVFVLLVVLTFLTGFVWLMPKVFRSMRLQIAALLAWFRTGGRPRRGASLIEPFAALKPEVSNALQVVAMHAAPLPESHARPAIRCLGEMTPALGIRAAATKSIKGLHNSLGYLVIGNDALAFVARRRFGQRVHRIALAELKCAEWKKGVLMNRLILSTSTTDQAFFVFKNIDPKGSC
jgi:hypothetical protein